MTSKRLPVSPCETRVRFMLIYAGPYLPNGVTVVSQWCYSSLTLVFESNGQSICRVADLLDAVLAQARGGDINSILYLCVCVCAFIDRLLTHGYRCQDVHVHVHVCVCVCVCARVYVFVDVASRLFTRTNTRQQTGEIRQQRTESRQQRAERRQ
jgi:hypothetical protein